MRDLTSRVLRTPGPPEDSFSDDALARATTLEAAYGLENDLVVRLAALLHDIGKPTTRRVLPDGRVTFHHHEVAGAAMARDRLGALRFPSAVVSDVSELVALHLRFHGHGEAGWTDAAVRRYMRDAGPLLTRLHVLTRADCTTRDKVRALHLERAYDDLERRITTLSAQEELDKIRPDLNGTQIMQVLGIPPGPVVGQASRFLLEPRMEHGPLGRDRAVPELLRWAEAKGLDVPGPPDTPPAEG
jgi:poly(A) polymerase